MLLGGEHWQGLPVIHRGFDVAIPGLLPTHSRRCLGDQLHTSLSRLSVAGEIWRNKRFVNDTFDLLLGQRGGEDWLIHLPRLPGDELGQAGS